MKKRLPEDRIKALHERLFSYMKENDLPIIVEEDELLSQVDSSLEDDRVYFEGEEDGYEVIIIDEEDKEEIIYYMIDYAAIRMGVSTGEMFKFLDDIDMEIYLREGQHTEGYTEEHIQKLAESFNIITYFDKEENLYLLGDTLQGIERNKRTLYFPYNDKVASDILIKEP